ncbi:MAG: hypothetical protein MJ245_02505 [Clostridia bacterium]|nr:hypothetical protein [Clostridia bacterium]
MKKLSKKIDEFLDFIIENAGDIIQFVIGILYGIFIGISMMLILTKTIKPLTGIIFFIVSAVIIELLVNYVYDSLDKAYDEEIAFLGEEEKEISKRK